MTTRIFVNLPVSDLERSMQFFAKLGFAFNPRFTDENAACMVVSDDIAVMLLTRDYFSTFISKTVADATKAAEVLTCLSFDERAKVDDLVEKAVAAGATDSRPPQDHGFMYYRSFDDLDGHIWEIAWMDPKAAAEAA
jgi:predicted lactoylglutathione lyase